MDFIKANFQFLVILILAGIILLERSCTSKPADPKPTIITIVDTSWKHMVQPITNVYPTVTQKIPYIAGVDKRVDTMYQPSPVDSVLRQQYQALRDSLLASNIYKQTLKYDSSSITLTDTVSQNHLTGRGYHFDLKYPVVTTTTTIKESYKPVTQLYIGGGITGNQQQFIQGFNAGLLLKNRKDQIYSINAGIGTQGVITYGISSYWKIKLHK